MIEGDTALYPLSQPPLQLGTWTWLCRSYSTLCPLLPTPRCPQSHTDVALEASDIRSINHTQCTLGMVAAASIIHSCLRLRGKQRLASSLDQVYVVIWQVALPECPPSLLLWPTQRFCESSTPL